MNRHIELVEKWLADKESVSLEELRANRDAADAADAAAYAAYDAAYADAYAADATANAEYCVKKYKELIE